MRHAGFVNSLRLPPTSVEDTDDGHIPVTDHFIHSVILVASVTVANFYCSEFDAGRVSSFAGAEALTRFSPSCIRLLRR